MQNNDFRIWIAAINSREKMCSDLIILIIDVHN